jgi:hypothetical protein
MSDSPSRTAWLVGLATATLAFLVAAAWFFRTRLDAIEEKVSAPRAGPERPPPAPRPGGEAPSGEAGAPDDLARKVQKLSDDVYDYYTEVAQDLHEAKRTLKQLNAAVRRLQQQMAAPGMPSGAWALAEAGKPPSPEVLAAYRKDAEDWGVKVSPGRVEVRGVLNLSPWSTMPIEFFVTRWPESGHETLIHVVGPAPVDEALSPDRLKGLLTAVYKGMVAAGFAEGEGAAFEPPSAEKARPRWVPPKGDTVYVGVRYELGGRVHLARATDWVVDPSTRSVLPEDAFRFTGSGRQEDFETGDEQLRAEASGILMSVYFNPTTLVEIAVPSNVDNAYQYNHLRIPKPARLRLENGAGVVDAVRDRARSALRVLAVTRDGRREAIATAPVLVVRDADGNDREVPFSSVDGAWEVTHEALGKGDWRVQVVVDGTPRRTSGFEPFYLDLVLSKTPIVPEGDGARPLEPIVLPEDIPTGTGRSK